MDDLRKTIRDLTRLDETVALRRLVDAAGLSAETRQRIEKRAVELVRRIRDETDPSMMELFLGEYGLSSDEGVALMCLAEALLRVPDGHTMDALIEDKIAPSAWGKHLGRSHSSLVNASTWALFMTGKVLNDDDDKSIAGVLHGAIKRLGEPVIRQAVTRIMKELGRQFVLGETIESAKARAKSREAAGYTYSYDMLGEAARTDADARRYHMAYADAITELAKSSKSKDIRENPGISIKLSALHPRYELLQKDRVMTELLPRARSLAMLAKSAGIGLNIDAEEAARLDLSLDLIEALLADAGLSGWDGFGVVVQAYSKRAPAVIDWLYRLAQRLDRRIMVRLVKGAYWDTEIKHAQVEGHDGFPVFTRKPSTDVSFIACAVQLLGMTDRIYPQFATHNAHTVASILELARDNKAFEFQRLHGMGEALHQTVLKQHDTRCRIYAPVGAHSDLLAYLVRRLLENGANSSFVNQIVDEDVPPEEVAADPFSLAEGYAGSAHNPAIRLARDLFAPERLNSRGYDLSDPREVELLGAGLERELERAWRFECGTGGWADMDNPANGQVVGQVRFSTPDDVAAACARVTPWEDANRYDVLLRAADLYEEHASEFYALLMREAGKTIIDCIGEVREAVDFIRYYSGEARRIDQDPAGVFACISPWNFPLAIFTGQIVAALATGNGVLAKPAETTSLIAARAVELLHSAGVPEVSLMLLPGEGSVVGSVLCANPRVNGVCFTGSTATARMINRTMAENLAPHARLIAETGGLNAMIVDSTALPEQAVGDVVTSAFQSAGQRCSALRVLYLQRDIANDFMEMLFGAMDELKVGAPWEMATDVGPVIDAAARNRIVGHIDAARMDGRILHEIRAPEEGHFVGPTAIRVDGIEDLEEEIFGPVLYIATFDGEKLDDVIDAINATGYGLTFCIHSRIDDRVQHVVDRVAAGNIYVNRNQIGAVVGSQPFGGEGLSGTGPKAGGPKYLRGFLKPEIVICDEGSDGRATTVEAIEEAFLKRGKPAEKRTPEQELPGPTGESNRYRKLPLGRVLCLGPGGALADEQCRAAMAAGCNAVAVAPGANTGIDAELKDELLLKIRDLDAVVYSGSRSEALRLTLSQRDGPLVPLLQMQAFSDWLDCERHVCIDTTAAGGNAALLAGADEG